MKKNTSAAALEPYGIYDGCEFEIEGYTYNPYRFTNGKIINCCAGENELAICQIITGKVGVTVLPWEPKEGDKYWRFNHEGIPSTFLWYGDFCDYTYRKAGNFARTEAELLSRKDEIMRNIGMIKEDK